MIIFLIILPFLPLIIYGSISSIIDSELPQSTGLFIIVFIFTFWIYLALRSEFLGKIYKKITILLPAAQLSVYTCLGLAIAHSIINSWAEDGTPTRDKAIFFAILAFVGFRLLMSVFYWIFPIARPKRR